MEIAMKGKDRKGSLAFFKILCCLWAWLPIPRVQYALKSNDAHTHSLSWALSNSLLNQSAEVRCTAWAPFLPHLLLSPLLFFHSSHPTFPVTAVMVSCHAELKFTVHPGTLKDGWRRSSLECHLKSFKRGLWGHVCFHLFSCSSVFQDVEVINWKQQLTD